MKEKKIKKRVINLYKTQQSRPPGTQDPPRAKTQLTVSNARNAHAYKVFFASRKQKKAPNKRIKAHAGDDSVNAASISGDGQLAQARRTIDVQGPLAADTTHNRAPSSLCALALGACRGQAKEGDCWVSCVMV